MPKCEEWIETQWQNLEWHETTYMHTSEDKSSQLKIDTDMAIERKP